MEDGMTYLLAADVILFVHVLFVAFVVLGLVSILVGRFLSWSWVRNPWFRAAHLAGIAVVVLQAWLGVICPLTTWEMALRAKAGDAVYSGSFVSYWLESLLYYQAPPWVFVLGYTLFGALVAVSWYWVRPRPFAGAGARRAADLVLALHFLFALFAVLGGFLAVVDLRVMLAHVPVVVWSSIVNLAKWTCPLTPLEQDLRRRGGEQAFAGSWMQHYIEPLVRPLGMPRRMELVAGISIVVWNVIVYGIVFGRGV
jgi:hypothetical protein